MTELSDEDLAILDLEDTCSDRFETKAEAIRQTFGRSSSRYYIRLNLLLDNPDAIYSRPVTVGRLRRLRNARAEERGGSSAHSPR